VVSGRPVRSFVIRAGRITPAQQRALAEDLPRYAVTPAALAGERRRLLLEIGTGNGENLLARAAAQPDALCIGCEVHPPGIGHTVLAADATGLANLRLHMGDAVEFLAALAPASLAEVCVFFPDPWPKSRHHKRRLVQAPFLAALGRALARGGRFYFASDHLPYAEEVRDLLAANPGWLNLAGNGCFAPRPRWRLETRFERRAARHGSIVHDLAAARR